MARDSAALLERLGHTGIPPRAKVGALRPAAKQIVSIARALSGDVRLLIMDEPSAILDEEEIETLFDVVRRLTAEGVGVIYISHRLEEIRRIGDRVTVLADGRTTATGIPADDADRRAGGADDRPPGRAALPRARRRLRPRGARGPRAAPAAGGARGEPEGARRRGRRPRRADRRRPQRAAGPDLRHRDPRRGRGARRRRDAAAGQPGGGDQAPASAWRPRTASRRASCSTGAWPRTRACPTSGASRAAGCSTSSNERNEVREQLRALKTVPDDLDRVVRLLSGGNQQKVVLARWLLRECRVLLLDEPTRGVDVPTKAEIYRLITDLAKAGLGVLVVSSELEELVGICTRILVMRKGEIVAEVDGATATEARTAAPRRGARRRPRPGRGDRSERDTRRHRRFAPAAPARPRAPGVRAGHRRRAAVRRRRDPQAGHVPDLGQHPQHAHAGERRRRARDRHDVRHRHRGHRPLGRLDGRRRRHVRRHPGRPRAASSLVFILGAIAFAFALGHASTRSRSPTAASCRSSRRWRCSRSREGWRCCSTTSCRSACSTSTAASFGDPAPFSLLWFGNGPDPRRSRCRSTSSWRSRSAAGSCSTAPATAATSSRSAATARPRASPACRCAG